MLDFNLHLAKTTLVSRSLRIYRCPLGSSVYVKGPQCRGDVGPFLLPPGASESG